MSLRTMLSRDHLGRDLIAGLTVSVLLAPQAMAYALLAGLPPEYGLYSSIVPLIVYGIMGSSPHLAVGPTALVSLLVLTGLGSIAAPLTPEFIGMAILVGLMSGLLQLILGVLRLGVLVSFLSRPVIAGFTSAAALLIALSQTKHLLGITVERGTPIYETVLNIIRNAGDAHLPTLALGLTSLLFLRLMKRWLPRWPAALIILTLTTLCIIIFKWYNYGIDTVKTVPSGLPDFIVPKLDWPMAKILIPTALTIGLISFIESLAISKTMESRHDYYRVNPNRELFALGLSKIFGAFFQAFPTTGSFSRSAINETAGAYSAWAGIVSALLMVLTLLFLTPLFYYLPHAALSAVIVSAVFNLIEFRAAKNLWRYHRSDFYPFLATFGITLFLGVQMGLLAGITLSLAFVIYRNARPHIAVLGRLPDSDYFRNLSRFEEAIDEDDILIIRFDSQLYFGNAEYFQDAVQALIKSKGEELRLVVIDASGIYNMDATGAYFLGKLIDNLRAREIKVYLARAIGPFRDTLYRTGLMHQIGLQNQFLNISDALDYFRRQPEARNWNKKAIQTNLPAKDDNQPET